MRIGFAVRVSAACAALALGDLHAAPAQGAEEAWASLAQGGKVVLMRHAAVEKGRGKGDSLTRDPSCRKERNLSDEGREEARVIGERFRQRNIPVVEVRYSPYCRTTDTAKIAFGGGSPAPYLSLLEVLGAGEAAAQTGQLQQVIGSYSGSGNLVLITHEPNINAVSFATVETADFLVLQPKGGEEFDEIGVVSWSESP